MDISNESCNILLCFMFITAVLYVLKGYSKEPFLSPGIYPQSVDKLLLEYPNGTLKKALGKIPKMIKKPEKICINKMIPESFCYSLYDASNETKQKRLKKPDPEFDNRVNYYNICKTYNKLENNNKEIQKDIMNHIKTQNYIKNNILDQHNKYKKKQKERRRLLDIKRATEREKALSLERIRHGRKNQS